MSSDGGHRVKDYELAASFRSIISLKLNDSIVNGSVADENALADAFAVIDEMFGENYRISMKYFQFVITSGTASVQFEISKINIGNLRKAYDTLAAHEMRFENHQIFNQVITLMVNSFTNGKDTIQSLQEIKSQGGEVTLALDINKRYRFSVYGKQFMIPPNITNAELLDIVGDVYALIESGLLNKRVFDFPYSAGRFNFDTGDVLSVLPDAGNAEAVEQLASRVYVCDLGMDKIALLDKDDKLMKIVELSEPIDPADKEKSAKLVILRDGMSKPQYAGYVEFLLTGHNNNRLSALYSGTEEPNLVLLDQLPYYYKPVPTITRKEFDFLREQVRHAAPYEKANPKAYRNYFARDINAKLYGYGGICPCCGYETGVLNSFVVKRFSIGLMNGEKEQKFNFSLYLCRNDAAAASGWIIDDISIGGMTPFLWLEEIADIESIPPEFLYCRIKFRRQVTYDIVEPGENSNVPETVYDGAPEVFDAVLSPMMAAKWFEDNVRRTEAPAPAEAPAAEVKSAAQPAPAPEAKEDADAVKPTEEVNRIGVGGEKAAPKQPKLTPRHPKTGVEPMVKDIGNIQM